MTIETMLSQYNQLGFSNLLLMLSTAFMIMSMLLLRRATAARKINTSQLAAIQNDVRALTTAAVSMGERVLEIERRQRRLAERQDQLDIYESANQPYEQAIRMAQSGTTIDELVNMCGLSRNEAELIHMMHRFDKAS